MTSRKAPGAATWLLRHFGCSPNNETILGDLVERHQKGRTGVWFCRQVIVEIMTGCFRQAQANKWLVFRAVIAGWLMRLAITPLFMEPVLSRIFGVIPSGTAGLAVAACLFAILVVSTIATGSIVSRLSGEQRTTAVISYAGSLLVYGLLSFVWQHFLYWRSSGISVVHYLPGVAVLFAFFVVTSSIGTILTLFGGGLLSNRRDAAQDPSMQSSE
jgi:hypothetical protein